MVNSSTSTGLSKRPRTGLAGPYGHPFHPILVTLPIGSWVSSLIFDIGSRARDRHGGALAYGSQWLIAIGIITAVIAAVFGLMDLLTVPAGTPARKVALTHMTRNLVTVAIFVVDVLVRRSHGAKDVPGSAIAITVVALLIL